MDSEIPEMELGELCDYLETNHHAYIREQGPVILDLLAQVQRKTPVLECGAKLEALFRELLQDLFQHLPKEEQVLFPICRQMARAEPFALPCGSTLQNPVRMMQYEHDRTEALLGQLRPLVQKYGSAENADAITSHLFQALADFDADLQQHMYLENEHLFPRMLSQAKR